MSLLRKLGIAALVCLVLLAVAAGALYAWFDGERIKAELVAAVSAQKQRTLQIAGPVGLSVWPSVALNLGAVSLSERNSPEVFAAVRSARVDVAVWPLLSRQIKVSAVLLDGLDLKLIKRKDGRFNFSDLVADKPPPAGASAPPGAPAPGLQLEVASLTLSQAQVLWRDEQTGSQVSLKDLQLRSGQLQADAARQTLQLQQLMLSTKGQSGTDAFALQLEVPALALQGEQLQARALTLVASLSGAQRQLAATLALSDVRGTVAAVQAAELALALQGQLGATQFKTRLASPLTLNLRDRTLGLATLKGQLELAHPALPMKQLALPLAGRFAVNGATQKADLVLTTQLDDSRLGVKAAVTRFSPLALDIGLDLDQLNVDRYLPTAAPAGAASAPAAGPDQPKIDLTALAGLDLQGSVQVGALQVAGLKLSKVALRLVARGGTLTLAPVSAQLYGGALAGNASVQVAGNAIAIRQTLTGVALGPLQQDLGRRQLLEGRGNLALDVRTRGETLGAMRTKLAGSAALDIKDGAIRGFNLAKSLRDLEARLGRGGTDTAQRTDGAEKTDFSELTASFKITDGVAHNEDLSMKSPYLRLGGTGDIDLGKAQLDYLAKVSVVNSPSGQDGQGLGQLKGLTIPVRLSGPFDSLSYRIEFSQLVSDSAKAKVAAKVDETKREVKQKVEDALKDKLKGLLGR